MADSAAGSGIVLDLAEEFLKRCRRGERPPLKEYTDRYPELESEIQELFPAMAMMEKIALVDESMAGDATAAITSARIPPLQQLGDFQIIREVGHGGMGVVYEAEQVSLGRHVALKVLPQGMLRDAQHRRRFEREAKAAARLHHTNIVPVFGVGEHEGTPFYVMQFIQGQGLDAVLDELRRLRPDEDRDEPTIADDSLGSSWRDRSAVDIARSLLSGRFQTTGTVAGTRAVEETGPVESTAGTETSALPASGDNRGSVSAPAGADLAASSVPVSPTPVLLPGTGSSADSRGPRAGQTAYWRGVTQIGVQVADALEYAHRQGVVHRDVKPSNLLLDTRGTTWVTDFGLAKVNDQQDLTHTGDLMGTLRYMPPEAFEGKAGASGDVYSLGLTLYELAALRPAFDEKDRGRLVRQVTTEAPPRLGKLNRGVPRDLETIIHKAIDREPSRRYSSAEDLAADLKRFLDDEPIQARRTGVAERYARWARRNPAIAVLGAILTGVLVIVTVGSLIAATRFRDQAAAQRKLADEKEGQRRQADLRGAEAVQARNEAISETYRASLSEVRALRLARPPGWRHDALRTIGRLATMETVKRDVVALRGEAVACLGQFDVRELPGFEKPNSPTWTLDFSSDGRTLAMADRTGGPLQLWDVAARRRLRELPGISPFKSIRFNPDGSGVALGTSDGVAFLSTEEGAVPRPGPKGPKAPQEIAFDRRGRRLAVAWGDHSSLVSVGVYDVATGRPLRNLAGPFDSFSYKAPLALSPDGTRVAVSGPDHAVQLYPVDLAADPVTLGHHRALIPILRFSPDGRFLASGSNSGDLSVKIWDVARAREHLTLFGHTARVWDVQFSPDGALLASCGDDQTVRLWDTQTGQSLMALNPPGHAKLSLAFSPDGCHLAIGAVANVSLFELRAWRVRRRLFGHSYSISAIAVDLGDKFLATGSADYSAILWDLASGQPLRQFPFNYFVHAVALSPDAGLLAAGLVRQGEREDAVNPWVQLWDTRTGRMRALPGHADTVTSLTFDHSGARLASAATNGTLFLWDVATGAAIWRETVPGLDVHGSAFLRNDSRLLVLGADGRAIVRDPTGRDPGREVRIEGSGPMWFGLAPAAGILVAGDAAGALRLFELPGLTIKRTLRGAHAGPVAAVALAPSGRWLASVGGDHRVTLRDPRTLETLLTFPAQTVTVYTLAFSNDGMTLAIGGVEEQPTLWDLAAVVSELDGLGLGWDTPALPGPPQPVAVDAGAAGELADPLPSMKDPQTRTVSTHQAIQRGVSELRSTFGPR